MDRKIGGQTGKFGHLDRHVKDRVQGRTGVPGSPSEVAMTSLRTDAVTHLAGTEGEQENYIPGAE